VPADKLRVFRQDEDMILAAHDPSWSAEFSNIEAVLTRALRGSILRIEHVGSTSIPGLRAKAILDIDVVIPGYEVFAGVVDVLHGLGYMHNGDQGIPEREAFNREDAFVPWTEPGRSWMNHHLYVCPAHGEELRRHVKFRDVLRGRADLRGEYEEMKLSIESRAGGDRKIYAQIKEVECREFVERILMEDVAEGYSQLT
jgi:GrpB-like predicted nucleotidyltransferase (UPF0157 family)